MTVAGLLGITTVCAADLCQKESQFAGQLDAPFDVWSESLCRPDWLRSGPPAVPLQAGSPADMLIFKNSSAWGFPSRTHERIVLRRGQGVSPHTQPM